MLLAVEFTCRYLRPGNERRVVKFSDRETCLKESQHMLVYFLFRDETTAHCLRKFFVSIAKATLHIGAGNNALGCCMGGVG